MIQGAEEKSVVTHGPLCLAIARNQIPHQPNAKILDLDKCKLLR
jgi:hypothetical protein